MKPLVKMVRVRLQNRSLDADARLAAQDALAHNASAVMWEIAKDMLKTIYWRSLERIRIWTDVILRARRVNLLWTERSNIDERC